MVIVRCLQAEETMKKLVTILEASDIPSLTNLEIEDQVL